MVLVISDTTSISRYAMVATVTDPVLDDDKYYYQIIICLELIVQIYIHTSIINISKYNGVQMSLTKRTRHNTVITVTY